MVSVPAHQRIVKESAHSTHARSSTDQGEQVASVVLREEHADEFLSRSTWLYNDNVLHCPSSVEKKEQGHTHIDIQRIPHEMTRHHHHSRTNVPERNRAISGHGLGLPPPAYSTPLRGINDEQHVFGDLWQHRDTRSKTLTFVGSCATLRVSQKGREHNGHYDGTVTHTRTGGLGPSDLALQGARYVTRQRDQGSQGWRTMEDSSCGFAGVSPTDSRNNRGGATKRPVRQEISVGRRLPDQRFISDTAATLSCRGVQSHRTALE